MAGIRVNTAVKKIEVNDNGDYITLNFSDNSFPNRFYTMLEHIEQMAKDIEIREAEIRGKYEDDKDGFNRAAIALYCEFHESIMNDVDALFGENTCKKVFGDIVPGIELFEEFFTQLTPYFEEYANDRAARLSRYSANRTGNV